jgi:mannosyltransferase
MMHMDDIEIIAPNFKRRLSGVTSTIIQLIPVQRNIGQKIAVLGPGLPKSLPHIRFFDLFKLWKQPASGNIRVWHARRNIEMLPALILRDVLRMPLKIVFTSASQRKHTGWTKFLISRMDAVIATSAKTAAYLDVPSTVSMHGINMTRFSPPLDKAATKSELGLPSGSKIAGCFGRVRHQKGTDVFVDAMIALLPSRPDWIAIIAGRATAKHMAFENALKARVENAGLSGRILFVGEHTNINEWYRALDLFVAPQRWEGFGLTPLEAMATGVPVVATDVGAFAEILDESTIAAGLLIAPGDVDPMVKACAQLMESDAVRLAHGNAGLVRASTQFTIEGEATKIGAVYRQLQVSSRKNGANLSQ